MTRPAPRATTGSRRGIQNCRVVDIGVKNFGECLKDGPSTCSYAVPFGYCFLCGHPRVHEMIKTTKKTQAFAGASR
jgi:hypothetical protein